MRANVIQVFPQYSTKHEGAFLSPYVDIVGLVTTSIGVLIDPIHLALDLPWMIGDRPATHAEIRDDWQALKSRPELKSWTAKKQAGLTSIRLTQDASDALVRKRLDLNIAYVRKFLKSFDEAPSDAQLATASLCWAVGAGLDKTRPAFVAAFNASNWEACKAHSRIRETNNPGVVGRNRDQELCWDNVITAERRKLDPAWLWWPRSCPRETTLQEEAVKAVGMIDTFHDTDPAPPPTEDES
jgi:GH24 family phage-related lysozyme (muramidase)